MATSIVFAGQNGKVRLITAPGTRAKVTVLANDKTKTVTLVAPKELAHSAA